MDPVIRTALHNAAFGLLEAYAAMDQVGHAAIPLHRLKRWHEIRRGTMRATREIESAIHGRPPHPRSPGARGVCPDRANPGSCPICKGHGPFTWDPAGISWESKEPPRIGGGPTGSPWAGDLAQLEIQLRAEVPPLSPADIAWALEKEERFWREAYEGPCPECGASPTGEK